MVNGDFRSTKRLIARSASSHCCGESAMANDGSASMTVSHEPASSIWPNTFAASRHERVDDKRVELGAPASLGDLDRRVDASDAVGDLDELGELHDS